jgi:hypothetical protein
MSYFQFVGAGLRLDEAVTPIWTRSKKAKAQSQVCLY